MHTEESYLQQEECKTNVKDGYVAEEKNDDDNDIVEAVAGEGDEEQADERDENGPSYFEEAQRVEVLLEHAKALLAEEVKTIPLSLTEYHVLQSCGTNVNGVAYLLENEFANILSRYQESPHLLHPHLEMLMTPLVQLMVQYLPSYNVTNWQPCSSQNNNKNDNAADNSIDNKESTEKESIKEINNSNEESSKCNVLECHALGQNFSMFDSDAAKTPLHLICKAVYLIIKTAGDKACTSYFPNDVHYYEDVFYAIRRWQADDRHAREWEVKYCLLLWMSNLVLVPFALSLIDTSVIVSTTTNTNLDDHNICKTNDMNTSMEVCNSLSDQVLVLAMSFLTDHSKCRDAAAILLARLLTRPDSERHRRVFFSVAKRVLCSICSSSHLTTDNNSHNDENNEKESEENIKAEDKTLFDYLCHAIHFSVHDKNVKLSSSEGDVNTNVLTSLLIAIAKAMKLGKRDEMKCHAEPLLPQLSELFDVYRNDTLLCKTVVKVAQRILLSLLRMHHASWRYSHHIASLANNLGVQAEETEELHKEGKQEEEEEEEEESNVIDGNVEHLEMGIALLLDGIGHKNTVVRWSAAKGIGRLCERLPLSFAQEVIHAIWDIFDCHVNQQHHNNYEEDYEMKLSSYHDSLWHGGLLSLAELCRRGLLMATDLPLLTRCIARGLKFDVSKGTYSVGSHVRDAACYTCWSLARAYNPEDLTSHVHTLSSSLITTALFDREVHVRRAAAAAFQECVGRLGNFPHGIELITLIDFFSLASLTHAYESIAVRVACFSVYTHAIVHELVYRKLIHWDRKIRELAARSLGSMAVLCVTEIEKEIIPLLLHRINETTLAARHGAVLGLAELIEQMPMDNSLPLHNNENKDSLCEPQKKTSQLLNDVEQEQIQSEIIHINDDNIMLSCNMWQSLPLRTRILEVITQLDSNRMFRARGGEHLRMACCKLLHAYASRSLNLPLHLHVTSPLTHKTLRVNTVVKLHEFMVECAKNILESVQTEAAITFMEFARVYYKSFNPSLHHKMIRDLLAHASHCSTFTSTTTTSYNNNNLSLPSSVLERRGLVALLGGIPPAWLLAPINSENTHENDPKLYYFEVIDILKNACQCTSTDMNINSSAKMCGQEENDPETRRNAIHSLSHIFTSISLNQIQCHETWLENLLEVFINALNDYSVDRRGDVGSFVRIAALQELPRVLLHCLQFATWEHYHKLEEESSVNNTINDDDAEFDKEKTHTMDVNVEAIQVERRGQEEHQTNNYTFSKEDKVRLCKKIIIKCLCNVLRLSTEKLDKVRAEAGKVLCTLFAGPCAWDKRKNINTANTSHKVTLHWELMQNIFNQQEQHRFVKDKSQVENNEDENMQQKKEELEDESVIESIKELQRIVQQIAVERMEYEKAQTEKHNPEYYKNVMLCNVKDCFDWHNPEDVMERVGLPFLLQPSQTLQHSNKTYSHKLSCFAASLVSGLIISAGDFAEHINKPARRVLQQALQRAQTTQEGNLNHDNNGVEKMEKPEIRNSWLYYTKLSECVINVAQEYAHNERVLTPFTRAVDVLLTQRLLDPNVHLLLVNVLRSELKHFATCITFLLPATILLANCCYSVHMNARHSAMQLALVMIASRYPKVRAKMATELYTALEILQTRTETTNVNHTENINETSNTTDINTNKEDWKKAIQILLTVQWDGTDAVAIRSARNSLYPLLHLTQPTSLAQAQKSSTNNNGNKNNSATEQSALEMTQASRSSAPSKVAASYKFLVREAGY